MTIIVKVKAEKGFASHVCPSSEEVEPAPGWAQNRQLIKIQLNAS
jgi:hypothetical protein